MFYRRKNLFNFKWPLAAICLVSVLWLSGGFENAAPESKPVARTFRLPETHVGQAELRYWHDEEVQVGDTFAWVLQRAGVNENEAGMLLKSPWFQTENIYLRAGQIISMEMDESGHIAAVQFFHDKGNGERGLVSARKAANGQWQTDHDAADLETFPSLRSVQVVSSVSGALARAGVPVAIRVGLKEIFTEKLDSGSLKEGDSIRILYESLYFRGQEVDTGNILAAEITSAGQTYYAYYIEHADGNGYFYDGNGEPLRTSLFGEPIEHYSRISSPYGIRIHPILRTLKMHTGVDYAAPQGTRILAASAGQVIYRGREGGYGNTVILRHDNGIETLYAHMSAFIDGVDVGSRVNIGDTIGLVGSTGRSTGPHLHYEVRIGGQHINPASVALPTPKLDGKGLATLEKYRGQVIQVMSSVYGLPVSVSQRE